MSEDKVLTTMIITITLAAVSVVGGIMYLADVHDRRLQESMNKCIATKGVAQYDRYDVYKGCQVR